MTGISNHPDDDVRLALLKLCDALCSWERNTGRESILVLREFDGFAFRADSGKPIGPGSDDITDEQLFKGLEARAATR